MAEQVLEGHLSTTVTIDLCSACQAFWFDGYESLRLSPGSVLKLFRLIGERAPAKPVALAAASDCPRCGARLGLAHDMQRNTRFEYLRCPAGHGRLTTFLNFLREKDFIRPLSPQQVDELRRNVQTVNCSNCGGAIDLTTGTACPHCGSALSMLDMRQAQALVATLRDAEARPAHVDPALPLHLQQARREIDSAFDDIDRRQAWFEEVSTAGLVSAGLRMMARLLTDRT